MKLKVIQTEIDPGTTELRWEQDGRIRVEQFAGSPEQQAQAVKVRKQELLQKEMSSRRSHGYSQNG